MYGLRTDTRGRWNIFRGGFLSEQANMTLKRDHNSDPNIKALQRRGVIKHGSTLTLVSVSLSMSP